MNRRRVLLWIAGFSAGMALLLVAARGPEPVPERRPRPEATSVPSEIQAGEAQPPPPIDRLPIEKLKPADIRDTFDQSRGEGRAHEAIDIAAPRGTPVVAVVDGVIQKLFTSAPGGLTIYEFDRAGTHAYYYAHLDRYEPGLREGDSVKAGDRIGYVGTTGNAPPDSPHLHFAVFRLGPEKRWWQGVPINPYAALQFRARLSGRR